MSAESSAPKYSGAEWLEASLGLVLSPLGRKVADIMGQVYRGIYHMHRRDIEASEWTDPYYASVRVAGDLASVDSSLLTELVVLAHDAALRLCISPRGPRHLELLFHQRTRSPRLTGGCPTMEAAVERVRERLLLPAIVYRGLQA